METISDPHLPYLGKITGGFSPGKVIRIQGTTPAAAYKFKICLQCGPKIIPRDDVALQVTFGILERYIEFNSLQNGEWGEAHREVLGLRSIRYADEFEIKLTCDSHQYKIAINDHHYYDFPYRIPYTGITHLAIDGDVSVVKISYTSSSTDHVNVASRSRGEASAPLALFSMETENNDNEMANSTYLTRPLLDSPPPTYEQVMDSTQLVTLPSAYSPHLPGRAPYPTGNPLHPTRDCPYPTGTTLFPMAGPPYPTANPSHPTSNSSYPTTNPLHSTRDPPYLARNTPYPSGDAPYPTGDASYSTRGSPPIYDTSYPTESPPQADAPLYVTSTTNSIGRYQKGMVICLCVVLVVMVTVIIIIVYSACSRGSKYC